MSAQAEIVPTLVERIKRSLVGLKMPRALEIVDAMEVCAGFELIVIENATALGDDVLEISKRREVLVGEWLIEDGPEVLSRLKLGRVRGQVGEPDPIRHDQVRCGVPAGAVQPEHDDALASRSGLTRKQRQQRG